MRRLVLLRHAKAVRPGAGLDDFDRALEPRGREAAPRAARLLADLGLAPDVALISAAERTRETWDLVAQDLPAREVVIDERLYLASEDVWLDQLIAHQDADTVLAIGHNPGLKDLAFALMGEGPHDARARERLEEGLPTSCAAVLGLDGAPRRGGARLVAFVAPERKT
jgi:phosphohistidine phosphatase